MEDTKYLNLSDFVALGLLQEVNRLFFHPMGLALECSRTDTGLTTLSRIWDYRDDPEGMIYDLKNRNPGELTSWAKKARYVDRLREAHDPTRLALFGNVIEPIPGYDE